MPRFEPFAGLRYDPSLDLDLLIAPPYDVVTRAERDLLSERHRANAIHIELPVDDPGSGLDRYETAARTLESWVSEGILLADGVPAFYVYRMRIPGRGSTLGVLGALGCEPPGGDVLPHEKTIPRDARDRLDLLRACRTNLSPIWGLSLAGGLSKLCEPEGAPASAATDDAGVRHELWVLSGAAEIEAITASVASAPVLIADGHHRYETACRYQDERRGALGGAPGAYDMVMALVVELSPEQLHVGAIHRALSGMPHGTDPVDLFGTWFDVVRAGPRDTRVLEAAVAARALALVTRSDVWLLTLRADDLEATSSDLDPGLVSQVLEAFPGVTSTHHHDWHDAVAAVEHGDAQAAILLRAPRVEQIADLARARRKMPPKSTYFYPKPRTGMVFRRLV